MARSIEILLIVPCCFLFFVSSVHAQSGSRGGGGAAATAYYLQQQLAQQQAAQRAQAERNRQAAIAQQQAEEARKIEAEQRRGIAVVELFTSEGCSSCPPADEALKQIEQVAKQRKLNVYPLSFAVDYWDDLGWKDPHSQRAFTVRQSTYAAKKETNEIYTPQMIVNGTREFLGSDRKKAHEAITRSLRVRPRASLRITTKLVNNTVQIQYEIDGVLEGYALNCALIQNPDTSHVMAGENAGKSLQHINVVRAFRVIVPQDRQGETELTLPEDINTDAPLQVVLYLQNKSTYSIVAANAASVEAPNVEGTDLADLFQPRTP